MNEENRQGLVFVASPSLQIQHSPKRLKSRMFWFG